MTSSVESDGRRGGPPPFAGAMTSDERVTVRLVLLVPTFTGCGTTYASQRWFEIAPNAVTETMLSHGDVDGLVADCNTLEDGAMEDYMSTHFWASGLLNGWRNDPFLERLLREAEDTPDYYHDALLQLGRTREELVASLGRLVRFIDAEGPRFAGRRVDMAYTIVNEVHIGSWAVGEMLPANMGPYHLFDC